MRNSLNSASHRLAALRRAAGTPVARNITSLGIIQIAGYLLPLLMVPYTVAVVGLAGYGEIAFAGAIVQYLLTLIDYGFNYTATRALALSRSDRDRVNELYSTVTLIRLALAALGFAALLVLLAFLQSAEAPVFLATYVAALGVALSPAWVFQGMERMAPLTALSLFGRLASFLGLVMLVHHPSDVAVAALVYAGGPVLGSTLALIVGLRLFGIRPTSPSFDSVKAALREGARIFVSTSVVNIYAGGGAVILGLLGGSLVVGYYSAASRVVTTLQGLITPVNQALFPRAARLQTLDSVASRKDLTRTAAAVAIIFGSLALLSFLLAEWIAEALFRDHSGNVAFAIRALSPTVLAVPLSTISATLYLLAIGASRIWSWTIVSAAAIYLVSWVLLAHALPLLTTACVALILAETYVLCVSGYFFFRPGTMAS